MGQNVVQIAYATAVPGSAVASIDIQEDGVIEGIGWDASGGTTTTGDAGQKAQLSFGSNIATTNDSRQVIDNCSISGMPGAAAYQFNTQKYTPMAVQVSAGERIYLHTAALGTQPASVSWKALLFISVKGSGRAPRYRS